MQFDKIDWQTIITNIIPRVHDIKETCWRNKACFEFAGWVFGLDWSETFLTDMGRSRRERERDWISLEKILDAKASVLGAIISLEIELNCDNHVGYNSVIHPLVHYVLLRQFAESCDLLQGPAWAVGSYSIGPPAKRISHNSIFKTLRMTGWIALYKITKFLI